MKGAAHQRLFVFDQADYPGGLLVVRQVFGHRRQHRLVVPLCDRVVSREQSLENTQTQVSSLMACVRDVELERNASPSPAGAAGAGGGTALWPLQSSRAAT